MGEEHMQSHTGGDVTSDVAPADIWTSPCECHREDGHECDGVGAGEDHLCRWCRQMCAQTGRPEVKP